MMYRLGLLHIGALQIGFLLTGFIFIFALMFPVSAYSQVKKPVNVISTAKALPKVLPKKTLAVTNATQRSITNTNTKKRNQKNVKSPKYRTLYVMTYKDKVKTHEFKFLKDIGNHKNTILKWKTDKKILVKQIAIKDALTIERGFKKIWGDSKYRTPSRAKKCTPYVNISSLLGKHIVCAENQKVAFSARNFLNEMNLRFKAKR